MSKREQIVEKIIDRMRLIKIADGYETDLGENVADWETDWDQDSLPALSICDLIDAHELQGNPADAAIQWNNLPVQLKIFTRSGQTADDLRKMIADIFKAIRIDKTWNNLAAYTKPLRSGMMLSEQSFELGGAAVEIEITYLTNSLDTQ